MKGLHFGTDNKSTGMFLIPSLWCLMEREGQACVFQRGFDGPRFSLGSRWGASLVTERNIMVERGGLGVWRSCTHFFQLLGQYPLKKLYLGKGAHTRMAGKKESAGKPKLVTW